MRLTRHHDDPSSTLGEQLGEQRPNQQKVSDMAHAHCSLERSVDLLIGATEESGVTDERVYRIGVDPLGEIANTLARAEIQEADLGEHSGVGGERPLDCSRSSSGIAAREDHTGSRRRECPRSVETDPAVCTGHDHELPRQVPISHRLVCRGSRSERTAPVLHGLTSQLSCSPRGYRYRVGPGSNRAAPSLTFASPMS